MTRYARRTDSTHAEVVQAFRAAGWRVLQVFRAPNTPDVIVAKSGRTICVEIKGPKTKVTPQQSAWHADWPGETAIVRTVADVMALSR